MSRFATMRDNLEYDAVVNAGPHAVEAFERMLANGESVSMAATLATRTPPRTGVDDRIIQANTPSVSEQFRGCEPMLDLYRKNYKMKTGENLPEDAVVYRGLAKYPGDPDCIVTHKNTLSDVKRRMRERNEWVEGDWENHPEQQCPEGQKVAMNDVAMARYKSEYRALPEYENVDERDLEAEILHNHSRPMSGEDLMNAATSLDQVQKETFGG